MEKREEEKGFRVSGGGFGNKTGEGASEIVNPRAKSFELDRLFSTVRTSIR
jgi:hypothetical protein